MQNEHENSLIVPKNLRNAIRQVPRLRAVVHAEAGRIVITFSDGRTHAVELPQCVASEQLIVAAVNWCRRHGARSVEIGA
jgi:hypothetical protein